MHACPIRFGFEGRAMINFDPAGDGFLHDLKIERLPILGPIMGGNLG